MSLHHGNLFLQSNDLINYVITTRKRSLGQGNAFTPVCDSSQGVSVPAYITDYMTGGGVSVQGVSVQEGLCQGDRPRQRPPNGNKRAVMYPAGMHSGYDIVFVFRNGHYFSKMINYFLNFFIRETRNSPWCLRLQIE